MLASGRSEKGFSIFELILVLTLVIVLVAIAIPVFGSNSRYSRLRSSAYAIAGQLNQAKSRSVAELSPYRLEFDAPPATGWRVIRRDRVTGSESVTFESSLNLGEEYGVPDGANSAGNEQQCGGTTGVCAPQLSSVIAFNTRGIPIGATGAPVPRNAVYLTNGREHFAVTVSLAGTVEVWRYSARDSVWFRP